ncbi:MAG: serine hydrolase [Chitinophagaceae bacterium]|nr:serine hydrolase [Chitinophagaceae bacterium]
MKKTLLLFIVLTSALFTIAQPDNRKQFISDSLDNYVQSAMADWKVPGLSLCVVKDGKVVLMKSYGVREAGGTDKVDDNTLFMIGSNTKAFTATAVAMLDAEKKLSLDDKVRTWLPDFTLYDPWVAKEATVRDLLCHRLGFETFQGDFMYFDSDLSLAEVREKMGMLKPQYGFRSKWGYTNCAFMTAGEVIPKVTGKTWAEFMRERIFTPLGMTNSLALSSEIPNATNKCSAHTVVDGKLFKIPYGKLDNLAPAGSIASSVTDMSHWAIALLGNGKWDGKDVIPPAAINLTRTPNSILGNGGHMFNKAHFSLYGLGFFLEEYAGRKIVAHTGGVNGFVTSFCLVPEEKLGIIVLTNTDMNNLYEALRNELEDAYLGLPYRNYSKAYLGFQQGSEKEEAEQLKKIQDTLATHPATALSLSSYAGEYIHPVYGKMNIKEEKGKLIMRFEHHHDMYGSMEPLGGNRFFCTYSSAIYGRKKLEFTVENNKVKSLRVRVADFVEFTPYDFEKVK